MSDKIPIVQVGLGALGRRLTTFLLERPYLDVVGAVDTDPTLLGQDLGEVAGLGRRLGVPVSPDISTAVAQAPALVAVHTTVSSLAAAAEQIAALLGGGMDVVSSCEELSFPWQTSPELSAEMDGQARAVGKSVLATGVNPGFLMDFLPVALTGLCRDVRKVTVLRYQDARSRRLPFQEKIGAGLDLAEFERRRGDGSLRHVGLTESVQMIASQLGWHLDRTEDRIEPVLPERAACSEDAGLSAGSAAGVRQLGLGYVDGEERIRLEFRAALGEREAQDTIIIEGEPPLRFTAPGGVNGDTATCAVLTNATRTVLKATPGLHTMVDLPPTTWFSGQPCSDEEATRSL